MNFPLTEKDLPGFEISEPKTRDRYEGCFWWAITKGFMKLSIYYDPSDMLGYVGQPYFEVYDFEDTYRYLEDNVSDLKRCIIECYEDVQDEYKKHPEKYL